MPTTDDPNDPRLKTTFPDGQREAYLVLPEYERAYGFVRPIRYVYVHAKCGARTTMGLQIAETYARNPKFYGSTFCCHCEAHFPLIDGNGPVFFWDDGTAVGS